MSGARKTSSEKRVFITGASSGIGWACAKAFAARGHALLLSARRLDKLQTLAEALTREFRVEVKLLPLDVSDAASVFDSVESLSDEWKSIDILVNNAGLARGLSPIQSGELRDWEEMIDTNIKGLLYVTRAVLPHMLARQKGHVINLGSIAGYQVYPGGAVYCATKFAVRALTEGLKMDLHGTPIRVSEVAPGMVHTAFSEVRFRGDQSRAEKVYQGVDALQAEDIAAAILYCAEQPPHVDVMSMTIFPTDQSSATLFHRE